MRIINSENYEDMSGKAAGFIAAQIVFKKDSVLGLATGSTVLQIYKNLASLGNLDFLNITTFNLDEYVGISKSDKNSYCFFMQENLFKHININQENTHFPEANLKSEFKAYDTLIENKGGIDLQLLGLGHNGHIGFNEPNDYFIKNTHCIKLSDNTRTANSRFFDNLDDVPTMAVTMGIKTIMNAKRILLCVSGQEKSKILKKVLFGPITPNVPGSVLQLHPDLTIIADKKALSEINI